MEKNYNPELQALLTSLTEGLGLGAPDLDLFEMALEQEFAERLAKSWDYFSRDPERLVLDLRCQLSDLQWLEERFAEREEYERCSIVQSHRAIVERQLLSARRKRRVVRVSTSGKRPV